MGVLHSIIRFLCCKTQTEQVDEESDEKSPLLVYQPNEDSSTFHVKGILQKLACMPRKAAAADPILPIQNPASGNYYNDSSAAASSPGSGPTTYAFLSDIDDDTDAEAPEYCCSSDNDDFTYSSGDTIGIDHILDWAILSAEVASANRLITKILKGKVEEEEEDQLKIRQEEKEVITVKSNSNVVVDELDHEVIIRVNSSSEIPPNTSASVADFKKQDRQQLQPKTTSKKTENVVPPVVEQSEKTVKKWKGKKRSEEQEGEAIIVKSTTVAAVVEVEERWIKHYSSRHRILLVGDGDFSFSASLAVAFGGASNMIATSLDSIDFLKKHYGNAASNIETLRNRGCKVMHGIDATEMANHALLGHLKFDRIIYNFPFAGFFKKLSREAQLGRHRELVSLFLKNAKDMICESGEIHISHKTKGFHAEWKLESIASSRGLRLIEAVKFNHWDYPGYRTKCGFGGDKYFICHPSRTYKFGLII